MKWSWRIATVSGIGIYVHGTFLLLLAYVVFMQLSHGGGSYSIFGELLTIAALFSIVVLHELGHAMAAKRYGIRTQDIILLPIGGVARLERIPEEPVKELVIAVAGPAVNVVLGMFCLAGMFLLAAVFGSSNVVPPDVPLFNFLLGGLPQIESLADLPVVMFFLLARLLMANVIMVVFNMLPAFPMDGGRVLRALLAMWTSHVQATRIAAKIGQFMAVLFLIVGLLSGQPFLMFIALFVWLGGGAEAAQVESRSMMGGVTARQAMVTRFQTVAPHETLHDVTMHIVRGFQQDFPVVQDGKVVGMLTRNELLKGLAEHGREKAVADIMHRTFETAEANEPLGKVFERLQKCDCHSLPVMDHGQLAGVIDMENVGEFIALRSALRSRE